MTFCGQSAVFPAGLVGVGQQPDDTKPDDSTGATMSRQTLCFTQ